MKQALADPATYTPTSGSSWTLQTLQEHILNRLKNGEKIASTPYASYPGANASDLSQAFDSARRTYENEKFDQELAKADTGICGTPYPKEQRRKYAEICWFCGSFGKMLSSMMAAAVSAFSRTQEGAIKLIALGFALWLVWTTAVYFFNPRGPGEFIRTLGKQAAKAVIGVALLQMSFGALNLIIRPASSIAFDYGAAVSGVSIANSSAGDVESMFTFTDSNGKIDPSSTLGKILMPINEKMMQLLADTTTLMRYSLGRGWFCLLPSIELFVVSLIVGVFSVMALIIFPMRIVDALFRIIFVMILTPILIVAWVFPITKKYATHGWVILSGALIFLMMLCITITVAMRLIDLAIEPYQESISASVPIEKWAEKFSTASIELMVLVATFLFALKLVSSTGTLAQELTGASIGSGTIGRAAVGAPALMALAVAKKSNEAMIDATKYTYNKARNLTKL